MSEARFDRIDETLKTLVQRFDGVDQRLDAMDERFDAMDQRFDAMDQRLGAVDHRLDRVDARIEELDRHMHVLHEDAIGRIAAIPEYNGPSRAEFSELREMIA